MFSGTLDTAGVTDLLGLVGRARKSGELELWGPGQGVVRFCEGDVTFASARGDRDLGTVLVRAGFVTADGWREAVAAGDPAVCLAAVLRRHQIDPERLYAYVRLQTEEAIWELERWAGEFSFAETAVADPLAGAFRYLVPSVLAGVRRRDREWELLAERVPSFDASLTQAPMAPVDDGDVTLSRAQYRVLTAADGRSVRAIAAALDLGLFAASEIVVDLLDAGLVVLGGGVQPAVDSVAGPATPAFAPEPLAPTPAPEPAPPPLPRREPATVSGPVAYPAPEPEPAPVRQPEPVFAFAGLGVDPEPPAAALNGATAWDGALATPVAVAREGALPARTPGLPAVDFVSPREQPARDLILRLLSAVKEL